MKKKLSLLLTIITPLLLINCSGKKTLPNPIQNTTPVTNTQNRVLYPTVVTPRVTSPELLGTPIGRPTSIIKTPPTTPSTPSVPQIQTEVKRPTHQNSVAYGRSQLSKKFKLSNIIKESSALIKIDGKLWTINDSGDKAKLYQINEKNGRIVKTVTIKGAYNRDWEALTYDDTYVYIGDFGNNRGNRKDLKIYKIPRADLRNQKSTRAETIHFKYSDQKDFRSKPQKNNFDCEAMVAYNGKLYLFSKNWQNKKTRLYEVTTTVGRHIAKYKSSFNINGLVTDATINRELDILLLSTYSPLLSVDIWAFTNYSGDNFFNGASKKLRFKSLQSQVEGITFTGNYKAYLSSEAFSKYIFSFDASLYELDFSKEFK
jgi:hypothetical protein